MLEIKTEETEATPENTSTTEEAKPEEEKTSKPEEDEEKDAKPDEEEEEEEENVSKPEEEQISQLEAENISPPEEEKIATPPPPPTAAAEEEENKEEEEVPQPLSPPPPPPSQPEQPQSTQINDVKEDITALNPLNNNEPEAHSETENKGKNRRYWTPKEEDRFFQIWGRENWRLTKHGKNTIFFAKWSEEMKERFNIDVKPEEVQCKVNQTRAKYR